MQVSNKYSIFKILAFIGIAALLISSVGAQSTPEGLRPPKHGGIYVVAHRGAHEGIPENTLAAYQKAIDLGCDFIEIDVRTTKDKVLVSIHDATIDRYTIDGSRGVVADMNLDELRAVDIGSRIGETWKNERIPTLDEIFGLCKGKIGVYLDVKSASVESLYEVVHRHEMDRDTLWYIPSSKVRELQERSNQCWPMPDPGPEIFLAALLKEHRPPIVASTWRWFSASFAKSCHDANALVIVDEGGKESWAKALQWEVDGIQTDRPGELIEYLQKNKR